MVMVMVIVGIILPKRLPLLKVGKVPIRTELLAIFLESTTVVVFRLFLEVVTVKAVQNMMPTVIVPPCTASLMPATTASGGAVLPTALTTHGTVAYTTAAHYCKAVAVSGTTGSRCAALRIKYVKVHGMCINLVFDSQ